MQDRRWDIKSARFVLGLVLILGCVKDVQGDAIQISSPGRPSITIGVCLPLSGNFSEMGESQRNAIAIANKLRPMVGNIRVSLFFKDSLGSATGARDTGMALSERDDVGGIIGGATTEEAGAMLEGMEKSKKRNSLKMPVIITTGAGPLASEYGFMWRVCSPLTDHARACARFVMKHLKGRRVGILLDPDDRTSVRLASLFSSALIGLGGTMIEIAYIHKADEDYGNVVHLSKKKPEIIYIPYSEVCTKVIAYARSHGVKTPFLVSNVYRESAFMHAVGSVKDVYLITDFHPDIAHAERARQFMDEFRKTGGVVDTNAALAADAYFLLTDALEMVTRKEKNPMRVEIPTFQSSDYLSGNLKVDRLGMIVRDMYASIVQGARLKYLDTIRP